MMVPFYWYSYRKEGVGAMTGRAAPMSRTTLELDHASAVPLYRQIYERLRRAVLDGHG